MSGVVMHPRTAEGRARQAQREMKDSGALEQQREDYEARISRRALVRHAEARMRERPRMHVKAERRQVGENLWHLLEEIEQGPKGITKARVLQKAINATPEDSTRHLARYACRPTQDAAEAERRTRYLLKTASRFVRIAKAAATLADLDPDEAVVRVLKGSYYTQDPPPAPIEADIERRTDVISALLSDIALRLCRKYPVAEAIQRMQKAGWVLQAPGDLTSPMRVDPTFLDEGSMPLPPGDTFIERRRLERYPHLHLGYVSGEQVKAEMFGRVVGSLVFQEEDGRRFETGFQVLDVRCQPVFRADLVLMGGIRGMDATVTLALGCATWIKLTSPLTWSSDDDVEYSIDTDVTIGEIGKFLPARDDAGFIDPNHGAPLEATSLSWPDFASSGSFMLITDSSGRVDTAIRPPRREGERLDAIQPVEFNREMVWLAPGPCLRICDQQILYRHFMSTPRIAHLWTDERPHGATIADHPLAQDPVPWASALDPVEAPEGSLSARLERWLRGELENCGTFEADLEAAIVAFLARIEATTSGARNRLVAAVYGSK